MMIYSSYASKKRRKFSFSSPFRIDKFFLVFAGKRKKISFLKFREKKVEKNNEKAQKTEQNENALLSLTYSSLKLRVKRTTTIYIYYNKYEF